MAFVDLLNQSERPIQMIDSSFAYGPPLSNWAGENFFVGCVHKNLSDSR